MRRWLALPALALLTGCLTEVGPDYQPPQMETGEAYIAPLPVFPPEATQEDPGERWWASFNDPALAALVEEGLRQNLDIRVAESQWREALATLAGAEADQGPTVDGGATGTGKSNRTLGAAPDKADNKISPTGTAALSGTFSWAADLFGGLARAEEAARADAERLDWTRANTTLTVASDIATTYVTLRGAERRLALTQQSLDLQRQTVAIVQSRVDAGLAPGLDRTRAEASVQSLEADLRPIETQIRQTRDSLSILLGRRPGDLNLFPSVEGGAIPFSLAGAVIGKPADLLRRRPDLRAAERDLARATAEIGVAESALYPSLTLPGTLSLTYETFGSGRVVEVVLASLSATLDLPLYDGGKLKSVVTVAEEQAQQALLTYKSTLLTALSEVEAALNAYRGAQERLTSLDKSIQSDEMAHAQARTLYTEGLSGFLDILDAQRTLTATLQKQALARTDLALAAVDLFRTAGVLPTELAPKEAEVAR